MIEGARIDLFELDFAAEDLSLPFLVLGFARMELRHDRFCEELKTRTDVLMSVFAGLVEENHLIDVRALEFEQLFTDGFRGADEAFGGVGLSLGGGFPLLVFFP